MWRLVGLARTDVSEECVASIFKVERISKLGTASEVTSRLLLIISTLKIEAKRSYETLVLARPTLRHIPDDSILHRLGVLRTGC
jgi:hypothetical protein